MEDINNSSTIAEKGTEKTTVSARVNKQVYNMYKEKDIPLSLVIESGLIYFMTLNNNDKIRFISQNMPEKVRMDKINVPNVKWESLLKDYFKKLTIPDSVTSGLLTGVCVGAVALIGSLLSSVGDSIFKDK